TYHRSRLYALVFSILRIPPIYTIFPYTTLFRSTTVVFKRENKKLRVHSNSKRIGCLTKKILILLSLIVHINQERTFNSYFSPFNHQFTSKLMNNQRYCL